MKLIDETTTGDRIARTYRDGRLLPIYTVIISDAASGDELYRRPVLTRRLARDVATTYGDSHHMPSPLLPDHLVR